MIKVALDTESLRGSQRVGHGNYVANLWEALQQQPGLEVVGCQPSNQKIMNTPRRFCWDQWQLPRQASKAGVEILHSTAFAVPLFTRKIRVATVHDIALRRFPGNMKGVSGWFLGTFVPWTFHFADRIISISEATKQDLIEQLHIPESKITVIPLAASTFFQPADQKEITPVLSKFGLKKEKFILFVGTLEPRKNLPFLVRATAGWLKEHSDYKLVLVGKRGWQYENIFKEIEKCALQEQVVETGYVSNEEKRALYSSAAVLGYASQYEGFGLPLLEAMACGCPVVAADNSSLPEVVGDGGVLIPLKEELWQVALARVLTEPAWRSELIKKGHQQAGKFSWEKVAKETYGVYSSIVRG